MPERSILIKLAVLQHVLATADETVELVGDPRFIGRVTSDCYQRHVVVD